MLYRRKVQQLAAALNEPDTAAQAGEILRGLIDRIVLTSSGSILKAELYGDLAAIMSHAEGGFGRNDNVPDAGTLGTLLSVVAGARSQRYLQALRARIPTLPRPLGAATPVRTW
jgi:hypothetical protein